MKALILGSALCMFSGAAAFGQSDDWEVKDVVLQDTEHALTIALNDQTILCSDADYGAKFLKIFIPQLKDLTVFNHRNEGAPAPCVAAGMCKSVLAPNGPQPSDVINASKPTEDVRLRVQLKRRALINHKEKTCTVSLVEEINVPVRGLNFFHQREGDVGDRPYEDCL